MTGRVWSVGDPEPLDDVVLVPDLDDADAPSPSGPWIRDETDARWVCACTSCATAFRRCGVWPARWPWDDLLAADGPLVEVAP